MQVQEATLVHRVFRVSRESAVISDRKVIRDVKALREMLGPKVRQVRWARQGLLGHREMSGFRGPEVFRALQDRLGQLGRWGRRV